MAESDQPERMAGWEGLKNRARESIPELPARLTRVAHLPLSTGEREAGPRGLVQAERSLQKQVFQRELGVVVQRVPKLPRPLNPHQTTEAAEGPTGKGQKLVLPQVLSFQQEEEVVVVAVAILPLLRLIPLQMKERGVNQGKLVQEKNLLPGRSRWLGKEEEAIQPVLRLVDPKAPPQRKAEGGGLSLRTRLRAFPRDWVLRMEEGEASRLHR